MQPTKKIIVEDYSPNWASNFQKLKSVYEKFLGNLILDIQHVGSTSVVGLAAKPRLDIDLIIESNEVLQSVIDKLDTLGYDYIGDLGVKDREAFRRRTEKTPEDETNALWQAHNLYVCIKDGFCLQNHLPFRDYLRRNPEKTKQYGELKKRLALEYPYDIDSYIKYKTPFVAEILRETGVNDEMLKKIIADNNAIDLKISS